jgi:UDP-N-acetylglucosamine 2-epimerase (non-hydrolysing)
MMRKTIITITGIRPDFIRMSKIFKALDENFNHILIHTGQHYDKLLSGVFFEDLKIREPDFNLSVGNSNREHFHQTSLISTRVIELLRKEKINPNLILFLGDSNSVVSAVDLKKEGYTIGHIEAGMRSGDKRMLEEINRTVCDHCSDYHFVYHANYKDKLLRENLPSQGIHVVGNTIVEACKGINLPEEKTKGHILLDIHRPENFKYPKRLKNIIEYANTCSKRYGLPIKMLDFKRTTNNVKDNNINLKNIKVIDLLPYKDFILEEYDSLFIISDSGTAQEEAALLKTPVIVPRDFTERPESVLNDCSFMIDVNTKPSNFQPNNCSWDKSFAWIDSNPSMKKMWLGNGKTSERIITAIKKIL